jgi:ubiquitin-protein ligase
MKEKHQSQIDAEKIAKALGLNGEDAYKNPNHFYNVTDVLIALMNWFDYKKEDDEFNTDFEAHLESAREAYEYENKEWDKEGQLHWKEYVKENSQ